MAGKKRIFISDIHMGTERSKKAHRPYGWLLKNATKLGRFLEQLLAEAGTAKGVDELVIVGDLFDDWVIPSSFAPVADTFELIGQAPQNRRIVAALKALAAAGCPVKVTYVPGNHDMAITRAFLEQTFPGIRCAGDYNPGNGLYKTGNIVAEHGHRFCLLNAPYTFAAEDNGYLPLGYYVSRSFAQKCHTQGGGTDLPGTLVDLLKHIASGNTLPVAAFRTVCEMAEMKGGSRFKMADGEPPSVTAVSRRYAELMDQWNGSAMRQYGSATNALFADAGSLDEMVWDAHGAPNTNRKTPRIVVCGHTHSYLMRGANKGALGFTSAGGGQGDEGEPYFSGYHYLYANAGTWVDGTSLSTYVLTEEQPDQGRHQVRVMKYLSGTSVEMLSTWVPM